MENNEEIKEAMSTEKISLIVGLSKEEIEKLDK